MGGYGAMRLGALHSKRFKGISAHSSITDYRQKQAFVEEPLDDFKLKPGEVTCVAEAIRMNRAHLPPLRFDCGTDDPLIEHNRKLHQTLRDEGIQHHYQEYPGGHTWRYWSAHLADTLRFFGGLVR